MDTISFWILENSWLLLICLCQGLARGDCSLLLVFLLWVPGASSHTQLCGSPWDWHGLLPSSAPQIAPSGLASVLAVGASQLCCDYGKPTEHWYLHRQKAGPHTLLDGYSNDKHGSSKKQSWDKAPVVHAFWGASIVDHANQWAISRKLTLLPHTGPFC